MPNPKLYWNAVAAAEMGRKSGEARRTNKVVRLNRTPEPNQAQNEFIEEMIVGVRERMRKIVKQMGRTADPAKIAHQAAALSKLEPIERNFTMRPSAGTMKPRAERLAKRATVSVEFDEDQVSPDQPEFSQPAGPELIQSESSTEPDFTPETPATITPS